MALTLDEKRDIAAGFRVAAYQRPQPGRCDRCGDDKRGSHVDGALAGVWTFRSQRGTLRSVCQGCIDVVKE